MSDSPIEVVVLGHIYPDSFGENIHASLLAMGHKSHTVDTRSVVARTSSVNKRIRSTVNRAQHLLVKSPSIRHIIQDRQIERELGEHKPRLVLCIDGYLTPDQVARGRTMTPDATWVLWYPDHLGNLGQQLMLRAPYDFLFFKDNYFVDKLRRNCGLPAYFLREACNPQWHRSETPADEVELQRYKCDLAVVGNVYPYREAILDQLPRDVDLKVYGHLSRYVRSQRVRTAFTGRYVTKREKALAFQGAQIVLNTMHPAEICSVNARLFEATACGGFVLTQFSPGLDQCFTAGAEVAVYEGLDDLVDSINSYLSNLHRCRLVAAQGQLRAHSEHTYAHRINELLEVCGIEH